MKLRVDFRYTLIAVVCLVIFTATPGHGCTCALEEGACQTGWKHGQVVFLGEVTAKNIVRRDEPAASFDQYAIHFVAREVFVGRIGSEKDTVVFTGLGGGDCGYPFLVGQSYLVYAYLNQNQLGTGICTQTMPAVRGAAVMRQLRANAQGQPASLFGMIGTAPRGNGYADLIETKVLSGVKVRLIDGEGKDYFATTDAEGVYSFDWLPVDKYRVEVDLPAGLSPWQLPTGQPLVIPISDKLRGCAMDVFTRPDGRISGVVIDGEGKGVAGFLTVLPADAKEAQTALRGGLQGVETSADGKFAFWQLAPGSYQLQFYPKVNGQISFRVAPFRTQPIEVGYGQHIENYEFKIK